MRWAGSPGEKWLERYEALRGHVLGEGGLDFTPLGLAVLQHRGMTAWMAMEGGAKAPAPGWNRPVLEDGTLGLEAGDTRTELVLFAGRHGALGSVRRPAMNPGASEVEADHLKRDAYLYIRQSTLRQVVEHAESTQRQYELRQRAVALGWAADRVIVIDEDQGQSAAGTIDRAGFQRLVGEVGMGRVGIVLGLEVSRLARSSTEWHRLLEICALTNTLILDEDGIYDPAHFNDRLLLGLKGTMSEAELHVLRARLRGGVQNKARRGELKMPLPTGLVYDAADRVVRDPERRVQATVRLFFLTFRRTGSASATVKHFRDRGILFPTRLRAGARKGEVIFEPLEHTRALRMLHNPRYAGAFAFGRRRTRPKPEGGSLQTPLPREQW